MPSEDETNSQNPIPEENTSPTSPQEPTEPAPENTAHSEPAEVLSEAPESPPSDFPVKSNDIPPSNSTLTEAENELKTEEKQAENETNPEPVSEPVQAIEPSTAQMAGNEPLPASAESSSEAKAEPEQVETTEPEPSKPKPETSKPTEATPPLAVKTFRNTTKENLVKAQLTIQNKKRKKLDLILTLFAKRKNITNDEVEKFRHVSDATATRYLSILEKENKIKQMGKTGHMVSYSKI